jgi:hypothetical protein
VTFSGALARWRGANAKRADGRYAADLLLATAGLAGPVPLRLHDSEIECQLKLFPRVAVTATLVQSSRRHCDPSHMMSLLSSWRRALAGWRTQNGPHGARGHAASGENHQKDDQLDRDERRDDEEDCEQMLIDELHVREVVARTAVPLHLPAKGK